MIEGKLEVNNMTEVRKINDEERKDVLEYYTNELNRPKEGAKALLDKYTFVTIEGYTADSPGYSGKVIFALYGGPHLHEVLIYEDGKLKRQESEREKILEGKLED